jgi:anti-anti-sigma factor
MQTAAPPSRLLSVEIAEECDAVSVRIRGELDRHTQPPFTRAFERLWSQPELPPLVRVVLSELEFIDSSGLALLIRARLRAQELGRELVVCEPTPAIARIFEVTGLTTMLCA